MISFNKKFQNPLILKVIAMRYDLKMFQFLETLLEQLAFIKDLQSPMAYIAKPSFFHLISIYVKQLHYIVIQKPQLLRLS